MLLGRWQAQKTARLYLNESRAVLTEMQLGPFEQFLAPYRKFFQNSTPKSFRTLEPLRSSRPPDEKRRLGGRGKGEETPSNDLQRAREERKKGRTLSSPGPGQGLGFGPPGWGGQGYPDTTPSLSSGPKKGGG